MKIMLSNYGHRYASERLKNPSISSDTDGEWDRLLDTLRSGKSVAPAVIDPLMALGLIQPTPPGMTSQDITRRYCQNPLEHVTRLSFELTTACNFHCRHCRNGPPAKTLASIDIEPLKAIVDVVYPLGIRYFDFIGGEISKFGEGWLELAQYIHRQGETTVALYTNGWWIDQTDFAAAGKSYAHESGYLADLKQYGVTHLVLSIDGAAERHDHWRRHCGLYRRITEAIPRIQAAGLTPRVSMVIKQDDPHFVFTMLEIAEKLYTFPTTLPAHDKIRHLIADKTNAFSNFIDIGQGVALSNRSFPINDFPEAALRCKAAYRPAPKLIITAQGEVAVCPLFEVGTGYGNIHQRSFLDILNHFQDAFVYQLHAQGRAQHYLPFLDREIFGDAVEHLCTLRAILTLIAKRMDADPTTFNDRIALRRINEEVAILTGHRNS